MKAVVMAGGEGTRLRPLTCTRPKPMMRILGKPVIRHIIDLLVKSGFDDIAVTVRYRAEDIENYVESLEYKNVSIRCVEEERILGTAGSVKNAAKNWSEPFLVISGDCVCGIEPDKVMLYHKSIMADATIVCKSVNDPREYGTVCLDSNGKVDGFCEKPDWSHAVSEFANTGIYIINPAVLDLVPDGIQYDFAAHLFPDMMNEGKRLFGYHTDAYWCDIGDIVSFRKCEAYMLSQEKKEVVTSSGKPEGSYRIQPPVYIGKNVTIGINSIIGPDAVIEDNVVIDDNTRIKKSIIMNNTSIGANCDIIGAVVGEKNVVKSNNVLLEGSCTGDGCLIENGCTISNNVLVWPEKKIPYRSVLSENLRDGRSEYELIGEDGIQGFTFAEMSCEKCCRLGEAVAGSSFGGKVGVGYDGTKISKTIAMAVLAGLISGGSSISDFGECYESQMSFLVSFCSLDSGIYISANKRETKIRLFGEYGLPLYRKYERELESRYKRSDFRRCCGVECNEINDMSSVAEIYEGQLLSSAGDSMSGAAAKIISSNPMIEETATKCFYLLGCTEKNLPEFTVDYSGRRVVAADEDYNAVQYEKLIVICAIDSFKSGNDICVPFDAPSCMEKIASDYERTVYRIGKSPMVDYDKDIALSVRKSMWAYDGLSLIFKILGIMSKQKKTLSELVLAVPEFHIARRTVSSDIPPVKLAEILGISTGRDSQGMRIISERGTVTVSETAGGRLVKIIAESDNMETAEEICVETEKKITSDTIDIYHREV